MSNNQDAIKLLKSSNNIIFNNRLYNSDNGVLLENSSSNIISNNSMFGINYGIHLKKSPNNKIMDNNILLCYWFGYGKAGICFEKSSNNKIVNNKLSSNYWPSLWRYAGEEIGIFLISSSRNEITNNSFKNDGIFISGTKVSHYNSHTIENNAVNGKPIYYYKNTNGIRVPEGAGEVILANCSNMTVENVNVSSSSIGVEIAYTKNSLISNINASNKNYCGIHLYNSQNNTISNNNANGNFNGIYIEKSQNNKIYLNNFINNTDNVHSSNSRNIWNSTSKITYTYNENAYTNYLGNYWSDYKEKYPDAEEIEGCGIWDTPYSIDSDKNNYPLMKTSENYFAPYSSPTPTPLPIPTPPGFEMLLAFGSLTFIYICIYLHKKCRRRA